MLDKMVSVVVPVYNGAAYLTDTVNSILNQDYVNFELILVDDGSSDNSFALMKELSNKDERIKIFSKENGGVACARNYGINKALGEFIAFCDQDDLWLPIKLSKQIPLFNNDYVGLVFCGAIIDNNIQGKKSYTLLPQEHKGKVFHRLIKQNILTCCTAIVRRKYLIEVDGFDDDRGLMGVDDWHLWLKLSVVCEFDFVDEHLAIHVFHGDNYSLNDTKMHLAELLCLEKIFKTSNEHIKSVDYSNVIYNLHIRYAKSYIFSGLYSLAGETYLQACKVQYNFLTYLKGNLFYYMPDSVLKLLKKIKQYINA